MAYDRTQPVSTDSLATSQSKIAANFSYIESALGSSTLSAGLSLAQGDVLYAADAQQIQRLAKASTATRYLSNIGTSNNPSWAAVNLANGVTGTLPEANGGTGLTALSGITTELSGVTTLPSVTNLTGLVSAASLAVIGTIRGGVWSATTIIPQVGGTGLTGFTAGDIFYASDGITITKLAKVSASTILTNWSTSYNTPSWTPVGAGGGIDTDKLDGQEGSYYRNASNINAGTLADDYGGTGNSIVNIGTINIGANSTAIITFATAFSNTNYRVAAVPYYTSSNGNDLLLQNKANGSVIARNDNGVTWDVEYIAIGT